MPDSTPASARPRILVADDDPVLQRALTAMFRREGFEVAAAADAAQALLRIRSFRPHAVVLDLGMPAGGGEGLFEKLRLSCHTQDIPVVILTGRVSGTLHEDWRAKGVAAVFIKPPQPETLVEAVRSAARQGAMAAQFPEK